MITIKEELVNKNGKLSLNELLVCLIVKNRENPVSVALRLLNRGVINFTSEYDDSPTIDYDYSKLVDNLLYASDNNVPKPDDLTVLVEKLQALYPEGRKTDQYGVPKYSWKGTRKEVFNKLKRFFKEYGNEYSDEQIIEATKRYVARFANDNEYMKTLPHFIIKMDKDTREENSSLQDELENSDEVKTNRNYIDMITA